MGTSTTSPGSGYAALRRPALRPGVSVVRRDDRHLQLGLDPPDRLVLADRPGLFEALDGLGGAGRSPDPAVLPVLDRLVAEGWLVDADRAAAVRRQLVAARAPVTVEADAPLVETVARACVAAGLPTGERPAALRLVVTLGEPRRSTSDALVRDDVPHLFVSVQTGRVRIGPFVEPGSTPCLRCVDAHLGERDPRRATVLHQLEQLPRPQLPWELGLAQLACTWAARDVVRRLDGEVPALRAATITLDDDLTLRRETWLRHPHCGCAWG